MNVLLAAIVSCSLTMALVSLVYMALMPLLSKRYAPKWRYRIWLVIVLGWIIPFRPQIEIPFLSTQAAQDPITTPFTVPQVGISQPVSHLSLMDGTEAASATFSLWPWLTLLWIIGLGISIGVPLWNHRRFVRFVNRWSEGVHDEEVIGRFERLKSELGITAKVEIKCCPGINSPMLIGFFHPLILLPPVHIPVHELELILRHELIHLKRHDIWSKMLVMLAVGIHWFNPVVYLMRRAVATQCEISCDSFVLAGADSKRRQQYGETIIDVIRSGGNPRTALSTNFLDGKKGLKTRLASIVDTKPKKTGVTLLCLFLLAIVITGGAWAATNKEEPLKADPSPSPLQGIEAKYSKLLDLRFNRYEEMTVADYRSKAWKAIGQEEAVFGELLNGIPDTWHEKRQSNRDIQFIMNVLTPILSEKWKSWSFGGTKQWESGMLEYGASYDILDADTLKMKDRNQAVEGLQTEVARFIESRSKDELADEAAMQALLKTEGKTWEQKYSTSSLKVTFSVLSFRAEVGPVPQATPIQEAPQGEERNPGSATKEDVSRFLAFQTEGYSSLSVAEFNRSLMVTMEDGGAYPPDMWERIGNQLQSGGGLLETLTPKELQFLSITLNASLSENSAKHMQEYSSEVERPYLKDRITREFAGSEETSQKPLFEANIEYTLSYTIPNEETLTVSERDQALMGLMSGARSFLNQRSVDDLVSGRAALESEIAKLEKQYSSKKIQLTVEKLIYQIYDERNMESLQPRE
ncbi:M56 family metallopeptidase [Gorillibacterium sp. CAU 1737]|uniref:M56 family metallopeptidase n=1 Tax=Gorillibacterium sp. CAU 1737 TaxID=3140362 RepID=UPI003261A890